MGKVKVLKGDEAHAEDAEDAERQLALEDAQAAVVGTLHMDDEEPEERNGGAEEPVPETDEIKPHKPSSRRPDRMVRSPNRTSTNTSALSESIAASDAETAALLPGLVESGSTPKAADSSSDAPGAGADGSTARHRGSRRHDSKRHKQGRTKSKTRSAADASNAEMSSEAAQDLVNFAMRQAAAASVGAPPTSHSSDRLADHEQRQQQPPADGSAGDAAGLMPRSVSSDSTLSFDNILVAEPRSSAAADRERNQIRALRYALEQESIADDQDDVFMREAEADTLYIGSVPVAEVEEREKLLERDRVAALQAEAERHRTAMDSLARRESQARRDLAEQASQARAELQARERRLVRRQLAQVKDQQDAFHKAESHLRTILEKQKGRMTASFGDLAEADDMYGKVRGRRYKVDWSLAPRLVRLRVDLLRAVKDKLPRGRYAVMVTLYDRLGGHPLRWSHLDGARWTGTTPHPQRHGGKFFNLEVGFGQKANRIFLACPSVAESRPSMCLVFELFLLRGAHSRVDKVVGWGAFPLMGTGFEIVQGKFRVPLLRGEMDSTVDKYETLETRMSADLDAWLCNLYFDVRHLPRTLTGGQKEYEVEMNFTSSLLQLKTRADRAGRESDSEHSADERDDAASDDEPGLKDGDGGDDDDDDEDEEDEEEEEEVGGEEEAEEKEGGQEEKGGNGHGQTDSGAVAHDAPNEAEQQQKDSHAHAAAGLGARAPALGKSMLDVAAEDLSGFRNLKSRAQGGGLTMVIVDPATPTSAQGPAAPVRPSPTVSGRAGALSSAAPSHDSLASAASSARPAARSASLAAGGAGGPAPPSQPVSGTPAAAAAAAASSKKRVPPRRLYELPSKDVAVTVKSTKLQGAFAEQPGWDPAPETQTGTTKVDAIKRAMQLEGYTPSVVSAERDAPASGSATEKLRYLASELLADLRPNRRTTLEFWAMVTMLVVVFWFRLYLHCLGQYLYLKSIGVAVFDFQMHAFSCDLGYSTDTVDAFTELGVVAMGPLTNITVFAALMLIAMTAQRLLGLFPDTASRFMLAFGVAVVSDPFLILLVESMRRNWSADPFRLYNFFEKTEGNGASGVFLALIVTAVLLILSCFVFYGYCLHVHMNGRMLDVYHRLHGDADAFFVPDDLEMSARTLRWILNRARRWTGFHGATRKIAVTSHIMKDHLDPSFEARTIHLALYTQDLYGERELYRHFVRRPDGAILELFDSVELMGAENYRKLESQLLYSIGRSRASDFFAKRSSGGESAGAAIAASLAADKQSPRPSAAAKGSAASDEPVVLPKVEALLPGSAEARPRRVARRRSSGTRMPEKSPDGVEMQTLRGAPAPAASPLSRKSTLGGRSIIITSASQSLTLQEDSPEEPTRRGAGRLRLGANEPRAAQLDLPSVEERDESFSLPQRGD